MTIGMLLGFDKTKFFNLYTVDDNYISNLAFEEKAFLRWLPFNRFLAKNQGVKKEIAMKKLLKNLSFGVDFKVYKKLTHST